MLDAWVANRDRHDENWSVLRPPPGSHLPDALAGSYDHASSLGFNVRDAERTRRLEQSTVEEWARRGTAWRFEHDPAVGPATLVDQARQALDFVRPAVRLYWLDRLSEASGTAADLVASVPEMSEPARTFAVGLLDINRRRLLHEHQ